MKRITTISIRVTAIVLLTMLTLGGACTKEYKVEIYSDGWHYDDDAEIVTIYLTARSTGEVGVKNVSCDVKIRNTFIPYSTPIAEKTVYFSNGSSISPGASSSETVVFTDTHLSSLVNWKIEVDNVRADPDGETGCSNPLSF